MDCSIAWLCAAVAQNATLAHKLVNQLHYTSALLSNFRTNNGWLTSAAVTPKGNHMLWATLYGWSQLPLIYVPVYISYHIHCISNSHALSFVVFCIFISKVGWSGGGGHQWGIKCIDWNILCNMTKQFFATGLNITSYWHRIFFLP